MNQKNQNLKKVVGVFGLSTNIINLIIGSGIFVLPAIVAAQLGPAGIFAYMFCGFLVTLVVLCFAEAGSRVTASGGAYIYIKSAFGPYFGFLTSILFIMASFSADAAVANAIVDITGSVFPLFQERFYKLLMFLIFFVGFGYINVIGVKNGMKTVKLITIVKLIPILLLIMFSWKDVSTANLAIHSMPSFSRIAETSLVLFFAFQGAEAGLSISGEIINPKRNIPRSIFVSILVVLILYILIQTVSQGVLGASLATFKENPLAAVANKVFGPIGFTVLTLGAAISMLGYLSSSILSIPRILYKASKDDVLPLKLLTKIHPRFHTPYIAVIAYATAGFLFAIFGGFKQLAIISSATVLLINLGVCLAVIKLRKINGTPHDGFKIPGGYLIPILASLTIVFMLSNLAQNEFLVILIAILSLSIVYFLKSIWNQEEPHGNA